MLIDNHEIEVLEIRPFVSKSMQAFIDVRIDFVIAYGMKIMKNENSELWVAFPSIEKDGKYFDCIGIDSRSFERQLKAEILKQYRQKIGNNANDFNTATPIPTFDTSDWRD